MPELYTVQVFLGAYYATKKRTREGTSDQKRAREGRQVTGRRVASFGRRGATPRIAVEEEGLVTRNQDIPPREVPGWRVRRTAVVTVIIGWLAVSASSVIIVIITVVVAVVVTPTTIIRAVVIRAIIIGAIVVRLTVARVAVFVFFGKSRWGQEKNCHEGDDEEKQLL
jgi:hypothetical protein